MFILWKMIITVRHAMVMVAVTSNLLGNDYMIPFCQDEISTLPAGTDFTLGLHDDIKFHLGKAGQVST